MNIQTEKYIKLETLQKQSYIKLIKDNFEKYLSKNLNLTRVSAPLFLIKNSGLQDDLSGVERKVEFDIKKDEQMLEVVQSLAKWKRFALKKYNIELNSGIYTDMQAIRRDENLDHLHSIYVDQWDWEKVIDRKERTIDFLKSQVQKIVDAISQISKYLRAKTKTNFPKFNSKVYFITAEDLLAMYPTKSAKEREYLITKKHKIVFVVGIGKKLSNGLSHDLRAPDYDDWDLNGDLLYYDEVIDECLEISSMGIRVDATSMKNQLIEANVPEKMNLEFHKSVLSDELPLSIGGGIGQSRLCMLLLGRIHIGEVQSSYWDKENLDFCKKNGIELL